MPQTRNRHHVLHIGTVLTEGPRSIYPPEEVDDYGWLECDLRIVHSSVEGIVQCAALYTDDTMNREEDFLPPLIRYSRWERQRDTEKAVTGEISWPTVSVTLSRIDHVQQDVDDAVRTLQMHLSSLPFAAVGLSAKRSVPEIPADNHGEIKVFSRTGLQRVEFASLITEDDDGLSDAVLVALARLRSFLRPMVLTGWREHYLTDPTGDHPGNGWWWGYGPPKQEGVPGAR